MLLTFLTLACFERVKCNPRVSLFDQRFTASILSRTGERLLKVFINFFTIALFLLLANEDKRFLYLNSIIEDGISNFLKVIFVRQRSKAKRLSAGVGCISLRFYLLL